MRGLFGNKRLIRFLMLICASFLICSASAGYGIFDSWQEKIYDRLFTASKAETPIVVVGIDDVTLNERGGWPLQRAQYAALLSQLNNAKAIAFDIFFADGSRFGLHDDLVFKNALDASQVPITIPLELRDRGGVNVPLLPLFASSSLPSFANIPIADDGIARMADLRREGMPSIACSLAQEKCPDAAAIRTHYIGKEKSILTLSFIDVVSGKIPPSVFENAYVLVGSTAQSLHDVVGTPFGDIPGVEVHAQILNTLLTGNYFKEIPFSLFLLMLALIHLCVLLIVYTVKTFRNLTLSLILLGIVSIVVPIMAFALNIRMPIVYMLIGYLVPAAILLMFEYISTSQEKKFIEETFKYYLMPDVINDLKNNPHKLKLGGEKRTVTVLFSDIRGFTSISEKLSPEELTRVINEYLTAMTDIIMEHGGMVDKYIGDAIMAFWGAPVENNHQAQDAAKAVVAMSAKLKDLNKMWKERNIPEIAIGVGLNKGEVIVGNMGSEKRFNYTIMGDEVNFGSRLEGLTKKYGAECLISESVRDELVKDEHAKDFLIRELDLVLVKGKKEPKKIFELMTQDITEEKKRIISMFEEGLEQYKKGQWDGALERFESIMQDVPAQVFAERIRGLKDHAPEHWNGVYEHMAK